MTIAKVTDPVPCCIGLPILFFRQCHPSLFLEDVSKNLWEPVEFGIKRLPGQMLGNFLSPLPEKAIFAKLGWVRQLSAAEDAGVHDSGLDCLNCHTLIGVGFCFYPHSLVGILTNLVVWQDLDNSCQNAQCSGIT